MIFIVQPCRLSNETAREWKLTCSVSVTDCCHIIFDDKGSERRDDIALCCGWLLLSYALSASID